LGKRVVVSVTIRKKRNDGEEGRRRVRKRPSNLSVPKAPGLVILFSEPHHL
jgi:hypothetical protein